MGDAQPGDAGQKDSVESGPAQELVEHKQEAPAPQKSDAGPELFQVRAPKAEDMGLVLETFIWGMYDGNAWLKEHLSRDHFWQLYRGVLQGLLSDRGTGVLILCLSDDPDTIIGYLVGSAPNVLHWLFVKKHFQKHGLAKKLAAAAGAVGGQEVIVTHQTDATKGKLPEGWVFKPYLLF